MKGQLRFEGSKDRFQGRIVVTVVFAAFTTHHPGLCQQGLILK